MRTQKGSYLGDTPGTNGAPLLPSIILRAALQPPETWLPLGTGHEALSQLREGRCDGAGGRRRRHGVLPVPGWRQHVQTCRLCSSKGSTDSSTRGRHGQESEPASVVPSGACSALQLPAV